MIWFLCFFILILIVLAAVFSAAETALTTVSRARIQRLSQEGSYNAKLVSRLQEQMERLLGTILLANNFVNILATSIATSIFIKLFSEGGIGVATLLMTILLIVFAEVMPKVYSLQNAEKFSLKIASFLSFSFRILSPITSMIHRFVYWVWGKLGLEQQKSGDIFSAKEELISILDMFQGAQARNEVGMLRGILDLSNLKNEDVLKKQDKVAMIDGDRSLSDAMPDLLKTPYSRFPVWTGTPGNVIGVVHLRFLTKVYLSQQNGVKPVKEFIATPPWFVSEKALLLHQLQQFKIRHHHMALVMTDEGTFQGIITLEDVLERIVGDISDEADALGQLVYPDQKGGYIVDGAASPKQVNKLLGWQLPEDETKTILGLILQEAPHFLEHDERVHFSKYSFKLRTGLENDVKWIHIVPISESHPS